jgi:hypothetical protein
VCASVAHVWGGFRSKVSKIPIGFDMRTFDTFDPRARHTRTFLARFVEGVEGAHPFLRCAPSVSSRRCAAKTALRTFGIFGIFAKALIEMAPIKFATFDTFDSDPAGNRPAPYRSGIRTRLDLSCLFVWSREPRRGVGAVPGTGQEEARGRLAGAVQCVPGVD